MPIVLAFGTFDGFHEGHKNFLEQAKALGGLLIVVVAQDKTAEFLKGRRPRLSLAKRLSTLQKSGLADAVVAGDEEIGGWGAVSRYKPDIIAVGYDQIRLKNALENFLKESRMNSTIRTMMSYKPDEYHSSLLSPES